MYRRHNLLLLLILSLIVFIFPEFALAQGENAEVAYRAFPKTGSRVAIWIVAQLHLYFAAFVLAVPMFALIIEFIGYKTGEKKYDKLAYDFTKLLSVSFSLTATLGACLTFMLLVLYPKFTNYFVSIFGPTFFFYVGLFFLEAFFLYSYYYGWGKFSTKVHLFLGLCLNVVGTAIMFIANGWVTFMTSPAGIDDSGQLTSLWGFWQENEEGVRTFVRGAMTNYTWMPINIHRMIANVAFGGAIASAYGAYKFLGATTDEERAQYDWMGYMGNFIAISAFLPLPFAGYWLGKEIYGFSQNLGMTLMGGAFSWLFIIQAILIGMLFLSANFYLWLGMGRIPGAERYQKFIKYILIAVICCFAVWATPSSIIATAEEMGAMGGSHHPTLKFLGVMSAKNTAVNILILSTYISFLLYRRGNKEANLEGAKTSNLLQLILVGLVTTFALWMAQYSWRLPSFGFSNPNDIPASATMMSWIGTIGFGAIAVAMLGSFLRYRKNRKEDFYSWATIGNHLQFLVFVAAISYVVFIGIYGYIVPTAIRIKMSVPQVVSVICTMVLVTWLDVLLFKGATIKGGIQWGKMRKVSQYALFFTAITFTWLMGLMGYVRSGLRQHWHVYGVMRDTSPDAFTPTLGYASSVVSVTVIIFFLMLAFVFWIASLGDRKNKVENTTASLAANTATGAA